jgi:predicted enzyme related to lactoylglutathione lyase
VAANNGKFIWYELMTGDTKAAETFYQNVIGWKTTDSGMTDRSYTIIHAGEAPMGGILGTPPQAAGTPPNWSGYIGVDDVDGYAGRVKQAGGSLVYGPEDIPGVGRFAVVSDPGGAMFELFRGSSAMPPVAPAPNALGTVGWHELFAADGEKAWEFYASLFGWKKLDAMDMGPMGKYQLFATEEAMDGGMMTKPAQIPHPFWLFYFNVDAVDAAAERVKANGGKIVMGPVEVPGGTWILQCSDPQGAFFAVMSAKR